MPDAVDLAIIATPAHSVPEIVRQCVAAGVKACIILSAGFKETGAEGAALEAEILPERAPGADAHCRSQLPGYHEPA